MLPRGSIFFPLIVALLRRCFLDNGNRLYCSKFVFIDTDMCTNNLRTRVHLLFVCFIALRSKSTAMVMVGRSVHLTTLFPRQV